MLNNYQYFIALAEELNISKAADRLFISHQCLSKYLRKLEQEYNVAFFERTPRLSLTSAGQVYLDMLRQVQLLESNTENQLNDIRQSKKGLIRFGTTEGRYRIMIPDLLSSFQRVYPDVRLEPRYATSDRLCELVLKNELDLALLNRRDINQNQFDVRTVLNERLYLVISDHLLAQFFPDRYPGCREKFLGGVDLADFHKRGVPFVLSYEGYNSRDTLETYLRSRGFELNCTMEMTQQDLHYMLAARDYAACFCWAMYLPSIQDYNLHAEHNRLNVFPVKGLNTVNQVVLVIPKGKILPTYGKELMRQIREIAATFTQDPTV
ncbi:MAG: LysR family transcriptional regulator [Oscillospiraceae bacterium]|nr:LysR family transcriptional regulator [Oscillospiraceae bacterium]